MTVRVKDIIALGDYCEARVDNLVCFEFSKVASIMKDFSLANCCQAKDTFK